MNFKKLGVILSTVSVLAQPVVSFAQTEIKDDLYQSVNQEWLDGVEIPSDTFSVDSVYIVNEKVTQDLLDDVNELIDGTVEVEDAALNEFIKFYQLANDWQQRDNLKAEPIKQYIEKINNLSSVADFATQLPELVLLGMPTPVPVGVSPNFENATKYDFLLSVPATILPDTTYYATEESAQLLDIYRQTMQTTLELVGYTQEEAAQLVEETLQFDQLIAQYVPSAEELSQVTNLNNAMTLADLTNQVTTMALDTYATNITSDTIENVNVIAPNYYEHFDEIINDEQLSIIKSWMTTRFVESVTGLLSEEIRQAGSTYSKVLLGLEEITDQDRAAFELATAQFDEVLGLYYAQKHFSQEARQDVEEMVSNIVSVYKERLKNNDWLSDATKEQAIKKLDNLAIHIGYPDKISPIYSQLTVDTSQNLVDNVMAMNQVTTAYLFDLLDETVDRDIWGLGAQTVNAFYSPQSNAIVFPAAILQDVFYNVDHSVSENYGAIGAVIAHEITHAFDPNGSLFDEVGNFKQWWQPEDYEKFNELTQDMVTLFDGVEYAGGKVNGQLTVTENIADAGGISAAYEALQKTGEADGEAFFTSWARVGRQKATPEYSQYVLVDVHAPNPLRVNIQAKNFDAFYEVFSITPEDGMYLAPENRVKIW